MDEAFFMKESSLSRNTECNLVILTVNPVFPESLPPTRKLQRFFSAIVNSEFFYFFTDTVCGGGNMLSLLYHQSLLCKVIPNCIKIKSW